MGIGINMIKQSTMTPKAAVASYMAGRSIHLPSVIVRSHPIAMGLQAKMEENNIPVLAPTLINMVAYVAHRNHIDWLPSWR